MKVLAGSTAKYLGFLTAMIFVLLLLLIILGMLMSVHVTGCESGALKYHGCMYDGKDVSIEITQFHWVQIFVFCLGCITGIVGLVAKAISEFGSNDSKFIFGWLVLITIIVAFVCYVPELYLKAI